MFLHLLAREVKGKRTDSDVTLCTYFLSIPRGDMKCEPRGSNPARAAVGGRKQENAVRASDHFPISKFLCPHAIRRPKRDMVPVADQGVRLLQLPSEMST